MNIGVSNEQCRRVRISYSQPDLCPSPTTEQNFAGIIKHYFPVTQQYPTDLEQLLTIDPPSPTPLESSLALAKTVASSLHVHDDDRLSTYSAGETLYDPEGYGLDILPAGAESDRQVTAAARYFALSAPLFQLLHTRARDWWLLAVDCSNFKVDGRTIISVVYNALFYHRKSQCNPTWQPMEVSNLIMAPSQPTFWSSIDDLVFR
ncbi:hypothetical protein PISMIDRAFT_19091 [Pisolithus microcarpus 441]|uniref:Uncharacterized protein n=1 Tax=Pisolithus microcarpus 441 TaxID=765257 RepID=A0A0C9XI32_9AGAM|nr:hypothetical protein PISMIDRAFT_19091 [Pisolithus microcarpus 441]